MPSVFAWLRNQALRTSDRTGVASRQIEGFGEDVVPESHAASFALLVYESCWLKHHESACFLAEMLISLPPGFYSPSQLVQDAQRRGVVVRAVDVMCSDWDCTMEKPAAPTMPVHLDTRPLHRTHTPAGDPQLRDLPNGRLVRACGIVVMRQQPQTAKGVVFVTLEDETGSVNVIVWKRLREKQRSELLHSRLLAVYGVWQRDVESGGEVRHLIAQRLVDLTPLLGGLATQSREFH